MIKKKKKKEKEKEEKHINLEKFRERETGGGILRSFSPPISSSNSDRPR